MLRELQAELGRPEGMRVTSRQRQRQAQRPRVARQPWQVPERRVPERRVPERRVPERRVPEPPVPERRPQERRVQERWALNRRPSETEREHSLRQRVPPA